MALPLLFVAAKALIIVVLGVNFGSFQTSASGLDLTTFLVDHNVRVVSDGDRSCGEFCQTTITLGRFQKRTVVANFNEMELDFSPNYAVDMLVPDPIDGKYKSFRNFDTYIFEKKRTYKFYLIGAKDIYQNVKFSVTHYDDPVWRGLDNTTGYYCASESFFVQCDSLDTKTGQCIMSDTNTPKVSCSTAFEHLDADAGNTLIHDALKVGDDYWLCESYYIDGICVRYPYQDKDPRATYGSLIGKLPIPG